MANVFFSQLAHKILLLLMMILSLMVMMMLVILMVMNSCTAVHSALCAVNYFQYALMCSVRLTKWAEMLRLTTGADLNNLPLPTGPS